LKRENILIFTFLITASLLVNSLIELLDPLVSFCGFKALLIDLLQTLGKMSDLFDKRAMEKRFQYKKQLGKKETKKSRTRRNFSSSASTIS
jgi:hypothetical protein